MKLVYGLCGLLISSSSLLSACNNEQNHPQNLLRVDIGAEPPTLDLAKSEDMNSTRIMYDLFAGLVDFNQQNQLIPGLAKKWEVSSDGKTYTFHLRDNLKFSDGSPISASDFVYSWRRLVDPHLASSYNMLLSGVVNGQDIN
jgi:oligopeptide transport system substrate-binding protein